MSPVTIPTPPPLPESPERRLVDEQLDRTRSQVKTVDVLFGLLAMVVGMLTLLLAAALVDHWLFDLRVPGRLAAWAALLGWAGYCTWRWIAPALVRNVNPLYAAHTIERRQPNLKNSLINYLLVRSHDDEAVVVRDALERQAAADITSAPVDTAVDRAAVLRLGYALVVVVLACAIYQVASPKSPWRTVARVLAPLADLARPSQVAIRDVTPGDAEVFHGHALTVSAVVEGLRAEEQPTILYSTADGQIVDAAVAMTRSEDGRRWQGVLPSEGSGAQQDFRYRLRAGDALSAEYRVHVSPAPSAIVRSIEYVYPNYTRRAPQTIENQGDISALEGTRITVRAEANQLMQSAWIEFDPPVGGGLLAESSAESSATLKRLPMQVEDRMATGSFRLEWDAQKSAPRHRSYRVRFVTKEGLRNEGPIVHALDVQRDLPPEVEVLDPRQSRTEIPEDGSREIVIRALDPDYGVSVVELRAVASGSDLSLAPLLNDPAGRTGQVVVKHTFTPRELGLKAGDQVVCWARAEDNRAAPGQTTPEPNSARTPNFHLIVTAAKSDEGANSAREKQESSADDESSDGGSDDAEGNDEGQGSDDDKEKDQGESGSGESGGAGQGESGQGQTGEGESGQSQSGQGQSGQGQSGQGQSGQSQSGGAGSGQSPMNPEGADSTEQGGSPDNNAGGQGGGSEGATNEGDSAASSQSMNGNPGGASGGQGQSSGQAGGARQSTPQNGASPSGEPSPADGAGQQPLSTDGAQDREVFERIQEYLKEQQQKQGGQGANGGSQPNSAGGDSSNPATPNKQPSSGDAGGQPRPSSAPQPGESPAAAGQQNQDGAAQQPDQKHGESEGEQSGAGQGGSPQGPAETQPEQANPQNQPGAKQPNPGRGDSGESGAGAKTDNARGSPESQEQNRDRQKNSDGGNAKESDSGASSPSTSKRQSDSQGGQGGDRSGGGEQGGGQGAKQAGNDSAGSSSAADEGAGAANEAGAGETSNQPGNQQLADRPTGNPSQTPGAGSGVQSDPQGAGTPQPKASPQDGQPGQAPPTPPGAGSPPSPNATQGGNREGAGQHTFGAPPPEGGAPDTSPPQDQTPPPSVPENAEVNLEYARKATDLALETLRDQRNQADAELLEKLGWTPEDMQRFLARWEAMKRAAAQSGPAGDEARQTMEETLESLGLRPANPNLRRGATQADEQRGLRDAGHRTAPPPEYRKQFEAYLKGAGRRGGQ